MVVLYNIRRLSELKPHLLPINNFLEKFVVYLCKLFLITVQLAACIYRLETSFMNHFESALTFMNAVE